MLRIFVPIMYWYLLQLTFQITNLVLYPSMYLLPSWLLKTYDKGYHMIRIVYLEKLYVSHLLSFLYRILWYYDVSYDYLLTKNQT